jgi:uncharacterized lipoprotein YbaY
MTHFKTAMLLAAVFGATQSCECLAQGNWLDYARAALPRANNGFQPDYAQQPQLGFPVNANQNTTFPSTGQAGSIFNSNGLNNPSQSNYGNNMGSMLVQNKKGWRLGVTIQNTEVGAVVTGINPGSAGQQAGLEPNDVIVAVGANRIGAFNNRIVELADELNRNTDNFGRVSLLVLNSRNRTLQSIPVTMGATSSALSGIAMTRDQANLPYGSVLTVQLQNVSQPYYEIAGGKSVTRADTGPQMGFELNIDPRYIDPRNTYQLMAAITMNNQELYRLSQPVNVNPIALGQPISLTLDRSQGGFANASGNANPGNVVNAGYPNMAGGNAVSDLYVRLLNRSPSAREAVAWQNYLGQGNSINDVAAKLLSSAQYRERFINNDSAYLQTAIAAATGRAPNQQEIGYWMQRLQTTGAPELVMQEVLKQAQQ